MLSSTQRLLKARVGTVVGSALLAAWALGAGLFIWQASFDENPLVNALASSLAPQTQE